MVETEGKSEDWARLCQGVSRGDVARNYPATVHCPTCDGWLCDVHAQGEQWHFRLRCSGGLMWAGEA